MKEEEIIEKITKKRIELGYSKQYMADKSGITRVAYQKIEFRQTSPKLSTIIAVCKVLKLSLRL